MTYVKDYKDSNVLRQSFNDLCLKTFGLSLERWYQQGLWGEGYVCHSIAQGNQIVANVSTTRMELREGSSPLSLIQIGMVMTDPDYRGKGLAGNLMERVIAEYSDQVDTFYLFANKSVLGFYPRFGFREGRLRQWFSCQIPKVSKRGNFHKLNVEKRDDLNLLIKLTEARRPTSSQVILRDLGGIYFWHCLEVLWDHIYYDPKGDLIVIYQLQGDQLHLFDLISPHQLDFYKVISSLPLKGVQEILFHFPLDSETLNLETRWYNSVQEDDYLFTRGNLDFFSFAYPLMTHT